MSAYKPWTESDCRALAEMSRQGTRLAAIALRLGRGYDSVRYMARKRGISETYRGAAMGCASSPSVWNVAARACAELAAKKVSLAEELFYRSSLPALGTPKELRRTGRANPPKFLIPFPPQGTRTSARWLGGLETL